MGFAPTNGRAHSTNGNDIRIIIVMSAADELLHGRFEYIAKKWAEGGPPPSARRSYGQQTE
jgi:hypothetical protein